MRWGSWLAVVLIVLGGVSMSACTNIGYLAQAANGHLKLMRAREPIDTLLADPSLDSGLRERLETLGKAREFAVAELGLPDTDSYKSYVATGRRAVTWNVVAAEEFSLRPYTWCFPIAGCVNYRGYFAEEKARAYADMFREKGFDVTVGGASAYSTLGWFDDTVLDTMLRGPSTRYVGTLFHEMAHQLLYVPNDSDFNEAYATFIEQEGVRRWLQSRDDQALIASFAASLDRADDFIALLADTRRGLTELYESDILLDAKRAAKEAAFTAMRERYELLKVEWGGYAGYDGWFGRELNNARLVSVSTYRRYIPAFATLFDDVGKDMLAFHTAAEQIGGLKPEQRKEKMEALLARASAT